MIPDRPTGWGGSYRLMSLWEMLEFNAARFIAATDALATLGQLLHDDLVVKSKTDQMKTTYRVVAEDRKHARLLLEHLGALELPVSAASIKRLVQALEPEDASADLIQTNIREAQQRMKDELAAKLFLSVPADRSRYYTPAEPLFGVDVAAKFPSAAFEIDEAGKCFALNRHTACVFHLMRVLEIGIGAIRRCLNIPDSMKPAERNWGNILNKIDLELKNRNTAKPPTWTHREDADIFANAHASLDAVKNVWRNATMHVERTYTEEEAEHIFGAVRGFMNRIASRLDESGHPAA